MFKTIVLIIFFVVFYAAMLFFSLTDINPDWLAYKQLFEVKESWLSDQGRDPVFLLINSLSLMFFGVDGYENFRFFIALYFGVFIALIFSGKILEIEFRERNVIILFISLILFGISRFTIQIREGVACTLVIMAVGILEKRSSRNVKLNNILNVVFWGIVPWLLIILSTQIHSSMSVLLCIAIISWLPVTKKRAEVVLEWRVKFMWLISTFFSIIVIYQLKYGGGISEIASSTLGDRFFESNNTSLLQYLFWITYAVICLVLYKISSPINSIDAIDAKARTFARILLGPAAFICTITIIIGLFMDIGPLVISSAVRFLYLFLSMSLVIIGFSIRQYKLIFSICLFLIADQIRNIAESIFIYFGVNVFY